MNEMDEAEKDPVVGEGPSDVALGVPPSRKAYLLLHWIIQHDVNPESFFAKINGQMFPGRFKKFEDETVVDETSNKEYASLMRSRFSSFDPT